MKSVLLHCKSVKLWGFFARFVQSDFFTELWSWVMPLVTSTWMHDCSTIVGVLAGWDRMILIFYKKTFYLPGNIFILTVRRVLPHVPPHQTTNYKRYALKQVNPFQLSTCGIISALSHWGPLINRAGIGWKEFFLNGKKLLHVQFCAFKVKLDYICGVTHHPFELQGVPVGWAVAFSMCSVSVNAEYSHGIP